MNSRVKIAISEVKDGTMKRNGAEVAVVDKNRQVFLKANAMELDDAVLVQLDYNTEDFCRYAVIDSSAAGEGLVREGRIADGLATQEKGLALFLPLADCIGVVLYDPEHEVLMLTHLGRHNLEQNGGQKSVEFMKEQFGSKPENIEVYFSPSAGKENYPVFSFGGKSLAEVAMSQLEAAGVKSENIELSAIDTTKDKRYHSHSEFLKGNRTDDGRFAIAAMLTS